MTALHLAAEGGHTAVIKQLLNSGASISVVDEVSCYLTVLTPILLQHHYSVIMFIQYDCVQYFGMDV